MDNRIRFSVIINRRLNEVLAKVGKFEDFFERRQGGYSFEAEGDRTRITLTSLEPVQTLFVLDSHVVSAFDEDINRLYRLKSLIEDTAA